MPQVTIENPVINSPFEEPRRHFRFTEDGITDEIFAGRRIREHFVPILIQEYWQTRRERQKEIDASYATQLKSMPLVSPEVDKCIES
jgi:hypothetical protein